MHNENHVARLEENRQKDQGSIETHIKMLTESNSWLKKETASLVNVLKFPNVKGRWGEIILKRVVGYKKGHYHYTNHTHGSFKLYRLWLETRANLGKCIED